MRNEYTIRLLDEDGFTITERVNSFTNKRVAILEATTMLTDKEYLEEAYKVEVLDRDGDIEWDKFAWINLLDSC